MKAISVLVLATCYAIVHSQAMSPDYVCVGPTAYTLAPAEVIAGGSCRSLSWSDDGRYVAVLRVAMSPRAILEAVASPNVPAEAEESLEIYDVARRKTSILWKGRTSEVQLPRINWLKGTDCLVGVAIRRSSSDAPGVAPTSMGELLYFDAAAGSSKTLAQAEEQSLIMEPSPTKGFALVGIAKFVAGAKFEESPKGSWQVKYHVLSADGRLSAPLTIPGGFMSRWSEDGASPIFMDWSKGADGKMTRQVWLLNAETGTAVRVEGEPKEFHPSPPKLPLYAGPGDDTLKIAESTRSVKPGWLVSADRKEIALVSGNVTEIALSPTLNAVAYVSEGAALIRPLVQIPKEMLNAAKNAAERLRVMNNAKQCALALIMYSADNDDMLPSNVDDVQKLMYPYLKNQDIMSGFVYSFSGGLMTDVKEPANTIMGYIPGPGGKAVVYVDGHVKWQADQQ
jgi:hypothetical protein